MLDHGLCLSLLHVERRKAAWLYAQFTVSKTVSLKKADVGLTFVRKSTVNDKHFTKRAPELGGLIEFYRSKLEMYGHQQVSTFQIIRS